MRIKPSDFAPHHMGDGKRFHTRSLNGEYQVYGVVDLHHICICPSYEVGCMIADALELAANAEINATVTTKGATDG